MTIRTRTKSKKIKWDSVLAKAAKKGEARVRGNDGQIFIIRPVRRKSPLDVRGIDLGLTKTEIVKFVRESRKYSKV